MADSITKNNFLNDVEVNRKILYKICHLYTNNKDDFEDLYQEILLQLWKAYPSFKGKSKISTWIYKISFNTAILALRKEKKKVNYEMISRVHYEIPDINDEKDRGNLELLKNLIQNLSDLEKAIITLYLDEFSYDEIAIMVGISKTNVATKISRIKEKMKSMCILQNL